MSEQSDSAVREADIGSTHKHQTGEATDSPTVPRGMGSSSAKPIGPSASGSDSRVKTLDPLPLPQPGRIIDCFELEEVIGVGGMGAVFRAHDTKLDREVALKLIPQSQSDDPDVVQRFYQEGRSAARLDHENIARVYTIGRDGPYHFIAFEYIEGENLRRRVETQGPLSVAEAINYTLQIAAALVHASERGVVHRDIKPSNIIITPRGRAKLVDMGLARQFEREEDHGLTQSGMTLGTFDYISPEQARDPRDVDVRSDLYSLGCTLFHMLTGRPPFAGGTVLQKLLQHQEESPPDVREYNPDVPPELVGVMVKLLAKDPDRRYQTPEQLVRDLLVLGGTADVDLGALLGHLGHGHEHNTLPSWIGHLVWFVPILGFSVVIAGLVWWSREFDGPSSIPPAIATYRGDSPRWENSASTKQPELDDGLGEGDEIPSAKRDLPTSYPKNFSVSSNEDLLAKLETAPQHSVISLSDAGPYRIGLEERRRNRLRVLKNRDLTIRAEAGARPVITSADGLSHGEEPFAAILDFVGGHITIEGVEFLVDTIGKETPSAAIRTEETELTLRRCTFRTTGEEGGHDASALRIRSTGAGSLLGDRSPAVYADQSHFGGSPVAIVLEGPVEIVLRDCTVASSGVTLSVDNGKAVPEIPARIHLNHASLMTGQGPVFRVKGEARFWVDDCVIAPAGRNASATLIALDKPRGLSWRGRMNRYSNIGTFLEPLDPESDVLPIVEFAKWADSEMREVGSRFDEEGIWKLPDPLQAIARVAEHPSQSFLLAASTDGPEPTGSVVGARQGPLGLLIRETPSTSVVGSERRATIDARQRDGESSEGNAKRSVQDGIDRVTSKNDEKRLSSDAESTFLPPRPMQAANDREADETGVAGNASNVPTGTIPPMPPMPATPEIGQNAGSARPSSPAEVASRAEPASGNSNDPARASVVANDSPSRIVSRAEVAVDGSGGRSKSTREVRSSDEFKRALEELGGRGGTIRIAAGAELEIPSTFLSGDATWRIEGSSGSGLGRRPQIRFSPVPSAINKAPLQWSILLTLRKGKFQFQGLDIVIPRLDNLLEDRVAAFGVGDEAVLNLNDCTITLAGHHENLAAIVAVPGPEELSRRPGNSLKPFAIVEITNTFVRSGGDFLILPKTPPGGILVTFANSTLVTDGSVLQARGFSRRGPSDRPVDHPWPIRLELDRVTARVGQSLVRLESTPDEPELPIARIVAKDSIFSLADPDEYLLRVDGHDQPVVSLRDNISWRGSHVAYFQVTNYRRDQNGKTGSFPKIYNRQAWANFATDSDAVHDQVHFEKWDPSIPAWETTPDDFRPSSSSPKNRANLGAKLTEIPTPPAVD